MAKNWAIVIGINQYNPNNFAPLKYAKRDAERMRDFFREAKFDEVCYFADDSPNHVLPNGTQIPTQPNYDNLISFLHDRFERPFLSAGDNCWFFFAGHGGRYLDRDYLMPAGANPREIDRTGIQVSYVRDRLCRCGADNVILILDACRNEGSRDGQGVGNEHQQGVITISACSPTQKSWEIDELQQGAFTYALLEALQISGERNCATVERLDQYLRFRVPELCRQYGKFPEQNPRISANPATKLHFILLPQYATLTDVAVLKNDAYRSSQADNNLELAEQLWIRIIAATYGRDMEALEAYRSISQRRKGRSSSPQLQPIYAEEENSPILEPSKGSTNQSNSLASWEWLVLSLVAYGFCGFALALSPAPVWAWLIALATVVAIFVTVAMDGTVLVPLSVAALLAVAWILTSVGAGWAVWCVLAGFRTGGGASEKLLESFNGFYTFLILIATSWLGLGLGWLVHWMYSLQGA